MSKRTAIILGASAERSKFGNKSVRAHQQAGYQVFPVNPKADEIEGLKVYPNLSSLPDQEFERLSVYLPPAVTLGLVDEIAAIRITELWLNPGSESSELLERLKSINQPVIEACSIVDLGFSPSQFPD